MFSERTRYITKLLCYLGVQDINHYRTIEKISNAIEIPRPYLGKIVGLLADQGYLKTRKGPSGGVKLAREPSEISMDSLLEDIEEYNHPESLEDTCCFEDYFQGCFIEKSIESIREDVMKDLSLGEVIEDLKESRKMAKR